LFTSDNPLKSAVVKPSGGSVETRAQQDPPAGVQTICAEDPCGTWTSSPWEKIGFGVGAGVGFGVGFGVGAELLLRSSSWPSP